MKGITLYQPWASLVALGCKPHETRSWATAYRGPLLIHASKRWDGTLETDRANADEWLACSGQPRLPAPDALPLGAVVALVDLVDCHPTMAGGVLLTNDQLDYLFGNWSPGRFAWSLANVRPLPEPIPWRGAQGLWNVPVELEVRVRAAVIHRSGAPA